MRCFEKDDTYLVPLGPLLRTSRIHDEETRGVDEAVGQKANAILFVAIEGHVLHVPWRKKEVGSISSLMHKESKIDMLYFRLQYRT